ncbi:MAG: RHS repeat domain-containing protein, partial [Bryobacteraceae bacterium]
TYYWDKHAFQEGVRDYTKARIKHWTHSRSGRLLGHTGTFIESTKLPLENRVWYNYHPQGQGVWTEGLLNKPTHIRRVLDDGSTQLTAFEYNRFGKVTRAIDPKGRETVFEYDPQNQIDLLRVKQKISGSEYSVIAAYTYNTQHFPETYTDAAGQTTSFDYNNYGQLTQVTNPLGHVTKYEYVGGYLMRIVNPNNQTAALFTYDAFGRVATRTNSEGHTLRFDYDALDRITKQTYPDGTTREYRWDKLDLVEVKDRQGRKTSYMYDAVRNLTKVTDPLNRHTQFEYYGNGVLKSLTDPNGNKTTWEIDVQGRVSAKRYADGKGFSIKYEPATSRLKTVMDAIGQVRQYSYAADDRLSGIEYIKPLSPTPNVVFEHDDYFARLKSMTDGSGTTQYLYHSLGTLGALTLQQEDGPFQNDTIAYQYDALGRVITRSVDASTERFAYDKLGRLSTHHTALGIFDFKYLGQTAQVVNARHRGGFLEKNWIYETNSNDRRLKAITNGIASRGYQYSTTPENTISRIIEVAPAGSQLRSQVWDYEYDGADRLLGASLSTGARYSYAYDSADNITALQGPSGTTRATHNALNQIVSLVGQSTNLSGLSYRYDANGNVTDDGSRSYKWDAENRLISILYRAQPTRRTTFRYDGLGRRVAIISASGANSLETRYLWCGEVLCQTRGANDAVSRRYYPQGEWVSPGVALLYAQDQLGSVRDVVVNSLNVASYDYDPYGDATRSEARVATDFRYAGMFYHQESGLNLTLYRPYDPRTGRWLSRDPIGELGGINLYGYVHGDPINRTDRLGLYSGWTAGKTAFCAAVTAICAWRGGPFGAAACGAICAGLEEDDLKCRPPVPDIPVHPLALPPPMPLPFPFVRRW